LVRRVKPEDLVNMEAATVHAFWVWDHNLGDNVRAPRMATLEAIKRVGGVPVEGTARSVDAADLDGNGFYPRKLDVQLSLEYRQKLRAFQSVYLRNVGNPLPREDVSRFIEAGLLRAAGMAVRLTPKGESALLL
jgi:hypothetical protein